MTLSTIALVLLSAALHAAWNFLLKRAGGTQVVVALSKVAEVVVFAPVFLFFSLRHLPAPGIVFFLTGISAAGVMVNYSSLAMAYRHGDLSFVYPIARGGILVFLPVAGFLAFGERLTPLALAALAAIVGGILTLNLDAFTGAALRQYRHALTGKATIFSLCAAFLTATFTIWDKYAVGRMEPFAYMYLYTVLVSFGFWLWLRTRVARAEVVHTWRTHWPSIVAVGVFNMASYLLVLAALRSDVTSYVLGMRQLSIVGGVLLGWKVLREPMSPPRFAGVLLITGGCLLLSFASTL